MEYILKLKTKKDKFNNENFILLQICRVQGIAIGQALLEAGYLESVSELSFVDGLSLYRPVSLVTQNSDMSNPSDGQEPLWVKQIQHQSTDSESEKLSGSEEDNFKKSNSNYLLNINVRDNIVHVSRPSPPLLEGFQNLDKSPSTQGKQSEILQEKINLRKDSNELILNSSWDKASGLVPEIDRKDPSHQNFRYSSFFNFFFALSNIDA